MEFGADSIQAAERTAMRPLLRVLFRNSRGAELEASHPIRFG
jgi:hypothetical protein